MSTPSDAPKDSFSVDRLTEAMKPLDADLEARLQRFIDVTRAMTGSGVFTSPIGLHLEPRGDGLFDVTSVANVNEFELRGMLTYFRQLWQNGEPAQFGSLRADLRKHVQASALPASDDLIEWLDGVGKQDKEARRGTPDFATLERDLGEEHVPPDDRVRAERVISDWVNGEVFHWDAEKHDKLNLAGDIEVYRFALLMAVKDVVAVYVLLAQMGNAILREPSLRAR